MTKSKALIDNCPELWPFGRAITAAIDRTQLAPGSDRYRIQREEQRLMRICTQILVIGALLTGGIVPSYSADVRHGLELAQKWCSSCHLVSPEQQRANADVPPFATIAKSPNFNETTLAYFLLAPHPKMPDMSLSRSEASDIAAYIATLRR